MAAKRALRQRLRFRRDHFFTGLSDVDRAIVFRAPPRPLLTLFSAAPCVGGYCARGSEAPVEALLASAAAHGAQTALPHFTDRAAPMRFAAWQPGDPLADGPWRVAQPAGAGPWLAPTLLLVPLLGFDRQGGRIGQGAGHYDRYCAAHPAALRIGVAWAVQEVDAVPLAAHDVRLDAVLTEQEWIVTGDRV